MKRTVQLLIRNFHRRLLSKNLPQQIAIYFHAIERPRYEQFRECLSYWKDHGYQFVNASDLCRAESSRKIFISFDDQYRTWLDLLTILDDTGVKVTFFVNTLPFRDLASPRTIEEYFDRVDHHGERRTLSTSELRELAKAGHVIGCHTHSHFVLSGLEAAALESEIEGSKRIIEDLIGPAVTDFAYPFGMRRHFSEALRSYCLNQGFHTVSNAIPGLQHAVQKRGSINRTPWNLDANLSYNLDNLCIDGRIFERLTGRSAVV